MGASSYVISVDSPDRKKVQEEWAKRVQEDARESGQGPYSGNATTMHGAITFRDLRCKTRYEAEEKILDLHQKWTGPVAVSYHKPVEPTDKDKARAEKAREKLEGVESKRYELAKAIQEAFVARKSALVGCKGCGSKLSVAHLHKKLPKGYASTSSGGVVLNGEPRRRTYDMPALPTCPVCSASLLSESDAKRIAAHDEKVAAARKDYEEARKPKAGDQIAWCVGGWAAE